MKEVFIAVFCALWLITCALTVGCKNSDGDGQDKLNTELRQIIAEKGLNGDPSLGRIVPDISEPLAQLGMQLFFTKALGGNRDTACVTCHHPALSGGDGLSLPVGVDALDPDLLGPGRMHSSGSPNVPRNSPSIFNIAIWDQILFWDGRVESLGKTPFANGGDGLGIRTPDSVFDIPDPHAGDNLPIAQSRFPVTSVDEMRGEAFEAGNSNADVRNHLAARIGDYGIGKFELNPNQWLDEFQQAFNSDSDAAVLISYENIASAISVYERSMVFVNTPWKAFVSGDDNGISRSAKRGALLFFTSADENGAGCSQCHLGDFFTDEAFHVLATPQIGDGKKDGENGSEDFGRFRETSDEDDMYAFRTPSLLNIEIMAPYGHSGPYAGLEGIVRHHLDPEYAVENYDYSQLDPSIDTENTAENTQKALMKLKEHQRSGISPLKKIVLSDGQVKDLVEFLKTLTDPCSLSRDCLKKWIPDETVNDPDGLRLNAVDGNGNPL